MFAKTLKKKLMMQAAVLAAPLFLVGCSSVPDAANPVEWYRSTVELFESDEPEVVEAKAEDAAESAGNTAAAPEEAKKQVQSGFVAAQTPQRQYAQPIMRQGDVVNPLGDAEKVEVAQAPAPQAAPTTPVQTTQIAESQPVSSQAEPQGQTRAQAITQQLIRPQQEVRSVGEVYAANISQTRPLNLNQPMRGADTLSFGNDQFETVVVSGSGVAREGNGYNQAKQMQFASLTQTAQTGMRDTYTSAMMSEPAVVTEGRAQSMRRFNPSMFAGSFQVATIQFGNGSANLTGEDIRILKEVLNIHQQQGGVIRIVGHASSRTRDMSPDQHLRVNHSVSLGRADKVARQLLKLGMPGEKLFVGGVSDSQPLYQEVMPSGEAGNRRTEIFVDY